MNLHLLSPKWISGMADKKVNDMEISAILEAFAESREDKAVLIDQSKPFKALIVFCNIYVLTFLVIYYSLKIIFLMGLMKAYWTKMSSLSSMDALT